MREETLTENDLWVEHQERMKRLARIKDVNRHRRAVGQGITTRLILLDFWQEPLSTDEQRASRCGVRLSSLKCLKSHLHKAGMLRLILHIGRRRVFQLDPSECERAGLKMRNILDTEKWREERQRLLKSANIGA